MKPMKNVLEYVILFFPTFQLTDIHEIMAFFESLRLKEFGFGNSIRNTSATSSTMSLCSKHKAEGSKIKSYPKMEGLVELMLKPVQTYKLPRSSVNEMPNSFELSLQRTKNFLKKCLKRNQQSHKKEHLCFVSYIRILNF